MRRPTSGCSTPCSTPAVARADPGPVFALGLTGPPEAGKTTALEALTDALCAEAVHHATVEIEALTSAHPPLDDDQWPVGVDREFGTIVWPQRRS